MADPATDNAALKAGAERLSTPSKVEEGAPSLARNIGLAGALVLSVGVILWLWNIFSFPYAGKGPPARWGWIDMWVVIGAVAIAFHAYRDRDETIRRLYGFFGAVLVCFGALWIAFLFAAEGLKGSMPEGAYWAAVGVASGFALLLAAFALAPLVGEGDEPLTPVNFLPRFLGSFSGQVQTIGIGVIGALALCVFAAALLMGKLRLADVLRDQARDAFAGNDFNLIVFGLLPYGISFLLFGLLLVVLNQATEEEEQWRLPGVYVAGWVGALFALAGLACGLGKFIGQPELMMPYGVILCGLAYPLLWAYLKNLPADSDLAYRSAWWLRLLGLVAALGGFLGSVYPSIAESWIGQEAPEAFLVPAGFFLIVFGLLYAWLGHSYCGEDRLTALVNRELAGYFSSPIAYIVIAGMGVVAWICHFILISYLADPQQQGNLLPEPLMRNYFFPFFAIIAMIAAVPMLTMRLLSEEKRSGTMEVLLTAPVDETQIVLSKFFSSWIMMMICWLTWLVFPLWFRSQTAESFDYRSLISLYVGLCLMLAAFLAFGLFCSALTRNQIVSFLLSFGGMLLLFVPFLIARRGEGGPLQEIASLTFFWSHLELFVNGQNHWKHILFYLSFAVFWLFLTVKVLEARKWK